jgi:pimeloyl-ACP methyl ester carboxylesterase
LAHHASPPAWSDWTRSLLDRIAPTGDSILVGHSSASPLVAELATKLPARAIIIVDGEIPPSHGAASPVRPALREFIRGLADAAGTLPIWSKWFSGDEHRISLVGLDILARDPVAFAQFEGGLPKMRVEWFDDTIELANWNHIPAGYIQTSKIYDHAAMEAQRRGWLVAKLNGTHLDPTLRPVETADTILSMSRRLGATK